MLKALALSTLVLAVGALPTAQDGAIGTTGGPNVGFAGCMYYEHANFGGGRQSIPGGVRRKLGSDWNDEISSIACNSYCEVTVYEHRDFNGAAQTFRGNIQFVGEAWNDDISSLIARCHR